MERLCEGFVKTLIVGAGALGGIIGARLLAAGASVSLATRNSTSAEEIKASGLHVTGSEDDLSIEAGEVAPFCVHRSTRGTRAVFAITSFAFMLVCVPEPVWNTTNGNSSSHRPSITYLAVVRTVGNVKHNFESKLSSIFTKRFQAHAEAESAQPAATRR
jgi:hypothetical protein